ncbi:Mitochondrial inner membrane protease subunit 1 [Babesia sp. Xinjiang]|uniref:Mitochondrial inner membrane protease subunit 1 n=1 Tax=Babesia sp. Xinjiang TaxID=462227 RepID=UPI000A232209|nr:Mitochondrial inner membrane protease subunit 1 [Babesia sp. Xinjiang]ORM40576.1 Mitochondrial inner membrane protease subunit 1 [Babesia sp. Xinjiang]
MFGFYVSRAKELGRSMVFTLCSLHLVTSYVFDITVTQGPSMTPTIAENSSVALYARPQLLRVLRGRSSPLYRNGDVVIAISPTNASRRICKRVVSRSLERHGDKTVPLGHVWLEGDNKSNSLDSRYYGPVSTHMIMGKVFLVLSLKNGARLV